MTTAKEVRRAIEAKPVGVAFLVKELLPLGKRASVYQVLYRMTKAGEIARIARGVYVCPKVTKYGPVMPDPYEVVRLIANWRGEKIGLTGAAAANVLHLSTQIVVRPVYATTGRTTTMKIGNWEVNLRHVAPRKMQYAGTPVGHAIAALWYLGKEHVTTKVIATLEQVLTAEDFHTLKQATTAVPGWAKKKLRESEIEREQANEQFL